MQFFVSMDMINDITYVNNKNGLMLMKHNVSQLIFNRGIPKRHLTGLINMDE